MRISLITYVLVILLYTPFTFTLYTHLFDNIYNISMVVYEQKSPWMQSKPTNMAENQEKTLAMPSNPSRADTNSSRYKKKEEAPIREASQVGVRAYFFLSQDVTPPIL